MAGCLWVPGEPKSSGWIIAQNGSFEGAIGHSNFIPSDPASLGVNAGDKIPYKNVSAPLLALALTLMKMINRASVK
ncbi:hypothetical protein [Myroides marinus]|uniref:hypothetical protein n=1 Tax=Myroides marinus TaxID=703342 RepID=UPI002575FD3B|nr:hypothetical protein [Myroides marinus]MDM1352129.1 hypothetical protein [Myroides marinus]MDM1362425.1 hypothetical protein [Myroides marinus]MDM1376968.1 hypothetical protein [Myroides marinus]MDM1384333.1 hypothetical protein [Myroides marinus]MDM1405343.1 hypothetical protein [Myroides marinus]